MKIKRCLVTGATGFIGQVLCRHLQANGIFVRALLRRPITGDWQDSVIADLSDQKQLFLNNTAVNKIDTVFHLAGIAHQGATSHAYRTVNVDATKKLIMLAGEAGVKRFIYFSSVKAIHPEDDYGRSKRVAEKIVLKLGKQYGMHVCIIQPALVYGPCVKGNIDSMLRGIKKGWFPPVPENHNQRSLVSVEDLVDAALTVAVNAKANEKVYSITDGKLYSTRQLYDAMRQAMGLSAKRWSIPMFVLRIMARIGDVMQFAMRRPLPFNTNILEKLVGSAAYDSELIQAELGWQPKLDFFKVLPEMVKSLACKR